MESDLPRMTSSPSPSPAIDGSDKPLNRLAQVSLMLQQARANAMFQSAPPHTRPANSSVSQSLRSHPTLQSLPPQTACHRRQPGNELCSPMPSASSLVESRTHVRLDGNQHEAVRPLSTEDFQPSEHPELGLQDTSQPRISWGFGMQSAQPLSASRWSFGSHLIPPSVPGVSSRSAEVPTNIERKFLDPLAETNGLQKEAAATMAATPPEWTRQLVSKVDDQPMISPAAEQVPVFDRRPTTVQPSEIETYPQTPQIIELVEEDERIGTPEATIGDLKTSGYKGPQTSYHEGLPSFASARSPTNSQSSLIDTRNDVPTNLDERIGVCRSALPPAADPEAWGSFSLTLLGEEESVPAWNRNIDQGDSPSNPHHGHAATDSQTQTESNASEVGGKQKRSVHTGQAGSGANGSQDVIQKECRTLISPQALQPLAPSTIEGRSPFEHQSQASPLHAERFTPSPILSSRRTAVQRGVSPEAGTQKLSSNTSSVLTTDKWVTLSSAAMSSDILLQDAHCNFPLHTKANEGASSTTLRKEREVAASRAQQGKDDGETNRALAAEPIADLGWSMTVQPGGSWGEAAEGTSDSKGDSESELSLPDQESLPFSIQMPATPTADPMLCPGTEAEDVCDILSVIPDESRVKQSKQARPDQETPRIQRLERATHTPPAPVIHTVEKPSLPAPPQISQGAATAAIATMSEPLEPQTHKRTRLIQVGEHRRGPVPYQVLEIVCPPAPRRRGHSRLVCDGRVPSSVRRADRQESREQSIATDSADSVSATRQHSSEEEEAVSRRPRSPARKILALTQIQPKNSTLTASEAGQKYLIFTNHRDSADESGPSTKPRQTYASRGRLKNKHRSQLTPEVESDSSDDSEEDSQQPLRSRRLVHRRRRKDSSVSAKNKQSQRLAVAEDIEELEEEQNEGVPAPRKALGCAAAPSKQPERVETAAFLQDELMSASDYSATGTLDILESVSASAFQRSDPQPSDNAHNSRLKPRIISLSAGLSIMDALKTLSQERLTSTTNNLPVGRDLRNPALRNSEQQTDYAAENVKRTEDDRPSSTENDLQRLREEQEEIRREQAWLKEQSEVVGQWTANSVSLSSSTNSTTQDTSWAEPRLQGGSPSRRQPDQAMGAERELREMRPLGKLVGDLLQKAQAPSRAGPNLTSARAIPFPRSVPAAPNAHDATNVVKTDPPSRLTASVELSAKGIPAPASKRDEIDVEGARVSDDPKVRRVSREAGFKGTYPGNNVGEADFIEKDSTLGKRPRMDAEEGRRKLARLLRSIRD